MLEAYLPDGPVNMFADGMGFVISSLGIEEGLAVNFVALTIFQLLPLTTFRYCTRISEVYLFKDFFEETAKSKKFEITQNRFLSTTVVGDSIFHFSYYPGGEFTTLWPIFGSANQLLVGSSIISCCRLDDKILERKLALTY